MYFLVLLTPVCVQMTSSSSEVVEEVFVSHLVADIPEFRHLKEKISSMISESLSVCGYCHYCAVSILI